MYPPLDLLVPTWPDLAGWASVGVAGLALAGVGRIVSGGAARPEGALVAGWGAAALVLTLWGVATPLSLRAPAIAIVVAGLVALAVPRLRFTREDWLGVLRIAVLALPLVAVLASARPSEPDTFLNLLPNAAYLYDHAAFPTSSGPPSYSFLPVAPYNTQFVPFLGALFGGGLAANGLALFTVAPAARELPCTMA